MSHKLDNLLHEAWLKIRHKLLANPLELRRRLNRPAARRVPRALCLAIKASDHRLNRLCHPIPDGTTSPGREAEHDLAIYASTVDYLCRPHRLQWGREFPELAYLLGAHRNLPRQLERRGRLRVRRIPNLGGKHGHPVPLVDSPVPAMAPPERRQWEDYGVSQLLDPGAIDFAIPDKLLVPYWLELTDRLPDQLEQTLHRTPVFRIQRDRLRFMHWAWCCPQCQRTAHTLYLPIGAPDFITRHNIQLPINTPDLTPDTPPAFACKRCHHVQNVARTPNSIAKSWSMLIAHFSRGLLFGHEVTRPAAFGPTRHNQPLLHTRPSPRRDQLEALLATTNLPLTEIARRMNWSVGAIQKELHLISKKHRLPPGRPALKTWWSKTPKTHPNESAA